MVTKLTSVKKPSKQDQSRLAESQEFAQALIRSSGTGIYIVQEGKFQYVNRLFQEMTGYAEGELVGTNSLALVHPDDRGLVRNKAIEDLKRHKRHSPSPYEYRAIRKSGEVMWVLENVTSTEYEGKPATVGSFIDITERKQAEEALRQSEERYRTILEEMEEGYFEVDLAGNYTFSNDANCRALGCSREELLGVNYRPYMAEEDTKAIFKAFNQVYRTGKPNKGFSYEVVRKDGSTGFGELSAFPLRNQEGKIIGFRGLSRDITERKQMEEALRQSEERYRTILENIEDGYHEVDLGGNFTFFNDSLCRSLGYSRDEMMGMNFRVFTPEEDVKTVYKAFSQVYRTGKPIAGFSWRGVRKDGTKGFAEASVSLLRNQAGEIIGFRGVSRDVTERKRAEREREALLKDMRKINRKLEQSNKELQDFVYIASHDLREPLRKMTSFGTLLQDSLKGKLDEDQRENFEFMIDGATRMQMMIDDLLAYSRVTTKAKPSETVDLNEVIEDLKKLELAIRLDETKGTIHVPETLLRVKGDPSQIHQLFQNLIGNGLKFYREGIPPEITIRTYQIDDDMVRVEIEDNGIGVDEEYYEQIFTMFKRLHSRTRYEGSGIGLAVCKKIVNRLGGDIGVKSNPGEGATFWFTLPRGSYAGDN